MSKYDWYRFQTKAEDHRPLIFPPPGPWWCTGYGGEDLNVSIIVAIFPKGTDLYKYWPEAEDVDQEDRDEIVYSGRFPQTRLDRGRIMKKFRLEMDLENDEFSPDPTDAIARVLRTLADHIDELGWYEGCTAFKGVHDSNGNMVGEAKFIDVDDGTVLLTNG